MLIYSDVIAMSHERMGRDPQAALNIPSVLITVQASMRYARACGMAGHWTANVSSACASHSLSMRAVTGFVRSRPTGNDCDGQNSIVVSRLDTSGCRQVQSELRGTSTKLTAARTSPLAAYHDDVEVLLGQARVWHSAK